MREGLPPPLGGTSGPPPIALRTHRTNTPVLVVAGTADQTRRINDPHTRNKRVNALTAVKPQKMWCGCGTGHLRMAHSKAQNHRDQDFRGADDGIRTRDPHLGKVNGPGRPSANMHPDQDIHPPSVGVTSRCFATSRGRAADNRDADFANLLGRPGSVVKG